MAFSFKITGIPRDTGMPVWTADMVNWWDTRALRAELPFREITENGYIDYVTIVSLEEARAFHQRFKPKANAYHQGSVAELERFLASSPPDTCFVLLNLYEWESGMPD